MLEHLLELGGIKKDATLLVISGIAVLCSLPIILEAIIGLVTAFDIKADVLVITNSAFLLTWRKRR